MTYGENIIYVFISYDKIEYTQLLVYSFLILHYNNNMVAGNFLLIKTHNSESRGQEEAGRTRRMSVLFTGSTGVKFVNALNKPPLKLSLSYQGLSAF